VSLLGQDKTCVSAFALYHPSGARQTSSTALQSFSYLGDLGVDDFKSSSGSTTGTKAGPQLQKQTFPQPLVPSTQLQWQEKETKSAPQFYEDVSFPVPPIVNPYDGATPYAEEATKTYAFPKVSIPSPDTSALTTLETQTFAAPATNVRSIWETSAPTVVQGGSLRTWNFMAANMEAVQVLLKTNGRPLHANVELWQGEDHTPQKIAVYTENGEDRPFSAFVATPYHGHTAIAVKNAANMEFPLKACVEGDLHDVTAASAGYSRGYGNKLAQTTLRRLWESARPRTVQGDNAAYTIPFDASVARVQILITTELRPLSARIELLQGPNNVKQVIEVSCEDGKARPFFCVVETPGDANVLRIVNTGPIEFPMECRVEPFAVVEDYGVNDEYFFDTLIPNEQSSNMFMLN
jgi:hypothetical protein